MGDQAITPEQLLLLALVQGLTEFAPVSSSAHLALLPGLLDYPDQGTLVDVAAHAGTLLAVCVYFRADLAQVIRDSSGQLGRARPGDASLAVMLAIATLPILAAGGAAWALGLAPHLRNPEMIAWCTIGFGIVLYLADRFGKSNQTIHALTPGRAWLAGCVQAFAILPGASRAGLAITGGRLVGLDREAAARFAFLLAIPVLTAATALGVVELWRGGDVILHGAAAAVFALSFLTGLLALWGLLRIFRRWSLTPFVVYRLVLGVALLWLA